MEMVTGDISSSIDYRGIAPSSLVLKVFDNCVLLLFGSLLSNDDLQFGFQRDCSTVQCTWAVQETISTYLRKGSEVYCCLLDFSKAFDKVNFEKIFRKLLDRSLPTIFLRLILYIYMNQSCYIRWNSIKSSAFPVKNGVRQGAILSPSLFCVYLDTLLASLRDSGVGCFIGGTFCGAFGYADDVTLLAPTRQGLQVLLGICEDFSSSHSMLFSTDSVPAKSKTMCMFFSSKSSAEQVQPLKLNGNSLPWVSSAKNLGNLLCSKLNYAFLYPETKTDLQSKRAMFFNSVHQVLQQFRGYEPKLIMNLISIYSTSFYGSPLWHINSEEHFRLHRSWNTAVRIVWNLPLPTHTRFLESLCPVPHLEATLCSRYIGFLDNLSKCSKPIIPLLFNSIRRNIGSQTGNNIQYLLDKCNMKNLEDLVKEKSRLCKKRINPLPENETWKTKLIEEIALILKGHVNLEFDNTNLEEILTFVCTD